MIKVRIFGLIDAEKSNIEIDKSEITVKDIIEEIKNKNPNLNISKLNNSIVFVNSKNITGRKRFSIILKDGDEIAFLAPASGG